MKTTQTQTDHFREVISVHGYDLVQWSLDQILETLVISSDIDRATKRELLIILAAKKNARIYHQR